MNKIILAITLALSTNAFSTAAFVGHEGTGNQVQICSTVMINQGDTGTPVGHDGTGMPVGHDGTGAPVGHDGTGIPVGHDGTGVPVGQDGSGYSIYCQIINIKS